MAHLALTIDRDHQRRHRFLTNAHEWISQLSGLVVEQAQCGDLAAVWGVFPEAPRSHCETVTDFAIVLGDAIGTDSRRLHAVDLSKGDPLRCPLLPDCDGFHVAAHYRPACGLMLGVDPLGLFPWYYAVRSGVLIAATSPALCHAHSLCTCELDWMGLTGILLTNGLVANRSLVSGVVRLGAGCQLRWTTERGVEETPTYRLPVCDEYAALSFSDARDLLDERMEQAVRRHRPLRTKATLLLSGGLDSRMLAGYLASEHATDSAMVLGTDTDFEVEAATAVAGQWGLPLKRESHEPTTTEFLDAARRAAQWEQLAGGFSAFDMSVAAPQVGQVAPYCWGGYAGDVVVGGTAVDFCQDAQRGAATFEEFLRGTNQWGVAAPQLVQLLGGTRAGTWVDACLEALRSEWDRGDERPEQRALRMRLHLRMRYHIAAVLHRLSMCSWPVLPYLDRRVLEVAFNLAPQHVDRRQLQYAIVNARFPALAGLPQDTNSFSFEPTHRTAQHRLSPWQRLSCGLRRRGREWYWRKWRRVEPRRYHRFFDPDGAYWRCVRQAAEPSRARLSTWLDPAAVALLWPRPESRLAVKNPFSGGGALRLMLGLCLWSELNSEMGAPACPVRDNHA